jgi:exosortase B
MTRSAPIGLPPATRFDPIAVLLLLVGFAALLLPTGADLLNGRWAGDSGGHEPLVVIVSAWLIYSNRGNWLGRHELVSPKLGTALLLISLLLYVFGRTQQVLRIELLAVIAVAASLLVLLGGWQAIKANGFALAFLLFAVPLPLTLELMVTAPLKMAVSATATSVLSVFGYPAGRSGVVITVGQYQLLVAEACAGLHSMVVLEAMGLLYGHLMTYRSWGRQLAMAALVVPLSFLANVARVLVLALLTYYYGDAVGQGYLHRFAGLLLFAFTLAGLAGIDLLLRKLWPVKKAADAS